MFCIPCVCQKWNEGKVAGEKICASYKTRYLRDKKTHEIINANLRASLSLKYVLLYIMILLYQFVYWLLTASVCMGWSAKISDVISVDAVFIFKRWQHTQDTRIVAQPCNNMLVPWKHHVVEQDFPFPPSLSTPPPHK